MSLSRLSEADGDVCPHWGAPVEVERFRELCYPCRYVGEVRISRDGILEVECFFEEGS